MTDLITRIEAAGIMSDPDIMGGVVCVSGQRMPVTCISDLAKAGYGVDQIMAEYPTLSERNIADALAWQAQPLLKRKERLTAAALKARGV